MAAAISKVESPLIQSYRQVLGVGPEATQEELKAAHRQLVQQFHPDRSPDPQSQEQFLKVQEAYEVLQDSEKIQALNQKFIKEKLFGQMIEGLELTFGSFFGYRRSSIPLIDRAKRLGKEVEGEQDTELGTYDFAHSDDSRSITDSPAYDSLELVFGGKFSGEDEGRVRRGLGGRQVAQLPWILKNNQGIQKFLMSDFEGALAIYEDLNRRMPRNIVFLYRLAVCHIVMGFKNQRTGLFGGKRPDRSHLRNAVGLLRQAISVGEARSIGKQKCLLPRKTLADLYQVMGLSRKAKEVWKKILEFQPKNEEAREKAFLTRTQGWLLPGR